MARIDRTFTARDLFRFYLDNLDTAEQEQFKAIFCFLCQGESARARLKSEALYALVGSVIGIIPIAGDAVALAINAYNLITTIENITQLGVDARNAAEAAGILRSDIPELFGLPRLPAPPGRPLEPPRGGGRGR